MQFSRVPAGSRRGGRAAGTPGSTSALGAGAAWCWGCAAEGAPGQRQTAGSGASSGAAGSKAACSQACIQACSKTAAPGRQQRRRRALTDDCAAQHGVPRLLLDGREDARGCPRSVQAVSDDAELAGGLGTKVLHDLGQPAGTHKREQGGRARMVASAARGRRETEGRSSNLAVSSANIGKAAAAHAPPHPSPPPPLTWMPPG